MKRTYTSEKESGRLPSSGTSIFQFYLINDETGDMWKCQWSSNGDEYSWIEKM